MNSFRNMKYVIKIAKKPLALCCCLVVSSLATAKLSGSLEASAIAERLKPMGQVNVTGAAASPTGATTAAVVGVGSPKDIYENNCKMCHQTGVAGAPKMGSASDWSARLSSQGVDTLIKTAISGIRAMPPKGNCLKCTPDDIKATVEYMLEASK